MKLRYCIAALFALFATAASGAEIAVPQVGQEVTTHIQFLSGTVLLPPGQWFVAATTVQRVAEVEGSDVAGVVLLQVTDNRVTGAVLAQGNTAPLKSRPSLSSECWSDQAIFTAVTADDDSGGACTAILPVATDLTAGKSDAWHMANAFAASHGWHMPRGFLVAAFRSVDRTRLMDVRYATAAPETITSGDAAACAWAASDPKPSAEMTRMSQGMTNFTASVLPVFEIAGHSHLPEMGSAPAMLASTSAPNELVQRLKQARIDELVERGSVSEAQADALARRAAEPAQGDPLVKELMWRSGYKTLTYKAATFIDTTAIFYLFIGNLPVAVAGSLGGNIAGMPLVYINDFAWSYFGLKASRSKQPFALASLGTICPKQ